MTALQPPARSSKTLYDTDYVQWVTTTAEQLRSGDYTQVDWVNLLDEIEDMAKRERQALISNLRVLLLHLLKWEYQPQRRTRSWAGSIVEHRIRIDEALATSPSLMPYLTQTWGKAYIGAVKRATTETGLPKTTFPEDCPFTLAQVMDENFPSDLNPAD
ncbi:MAG: DUF29 domain-containing protein [Cyanobacteria bacterium P01_A01_bin.105]